MHENVVRISQTLIVQTRPLESLRRSWRLPGFLVQCVCGTRFDKIPKDLQSHTVPSYYHCIKHLINNDETINVMIMWVKTWFMSKHWLFQRNGMTNDESALCHKAERQMTKEKENISDAWKSTVRLREYFLFGGQNTRSTNTKQQKKYLKDMQQI